MQTDITIAAAQADMRSGYLDGAPGIAASSAAWLMAAAVAFSASPSAAVWTLLVAGACIHPAGIVLARLLGATLCMAAVALVFLRAPVAMSALVGGLIDLGFAVVLLRSARKTAA